MELALPVKVRNKFTIEIADSRTQETRQIAEAYNIVLDTCYTRLGQFATYFTGIAFGRGTGTLSPSRTSLFSAIGYKTATTVETVKEFPVSSWTRKITLNPEEFVGETITEVGIVYETGTSYLSTHALLQDAEGEPISITKTAVDVITIYATFYVDFGGEWLPDGHSKIHWCTPASNNSIVNKLIGNTSFPNYRYTLGAVGDDRNTSAPVIGEIAAATTNQSYTYDVQNRETVFSSYRFGVSEGNAEIHSIGLKDISSNGNHFLRIQLPCPGIFEGIQMNNQPFGVGDGVKTHFSLPFVQVKNLSVKADGVSANASISNSVASISPSWPVPADYPAAYTGGSVPPELIRSWHPSGRFVAYSCVPVPFFAVAEIDPDTGQFIRALPNPETSGSGDDGYTASFSPNGKYVCYAGRNGAARIYRFDAESGCIGERVFSSGGTRGGFAGFLTDEFFVFVTYGSTDYLYTYFVSQDGVFTQCGFRPGWDLGGYHSLRLSEDKRFAIVFGEYYNSIYPRIVLWRLNPEEGAVVGQITGPAPPVGISSGYMSGVALNLVGDWAFGYWTAGNAGWHRRNFSVDWDTLTVTYNTAWERLPVQPASGAWQFLTADLALIGGRLYRVTQQGDVLGELPRPTDLPKLVSLSPNGKFAVDLLGGSSRKLLCRTDLNESRAHAIFDTPPVEDVVLTADYFADFIPKSKDYVLDVSIRLKW